MAKVTFDTASIIAKVRRGAVRGVLAATEDVRNEVIRLILDTAKTGRIYNTRFFTIGTGPDRRVIPYGSRPSHQASAPGEPPASDTGTLVNHITTEYSEDGLRGSVMARTKYAEYLEYGTDRMEPRPFMRPALMNQHEAIGQTIAEAIRNELLRPSPGIVATDVAPTVSELGKGIAEGG